ncbi:hypothetical protein AB1Y20_022321 [Prymnesium parvum]|uniref:Uncharacterized protein n=1 Tax=Prymnesium parvum TaxID=97485 RepID=A0AB34JFJ5_PRYPA
MILQGNPARSSSPRGRWPSCSPQRVLIPACGLLAGVQLAASLRAWRHSAAEQAPPLAALLPSDLDLVQSPVVISALGVQLLLFGGFLPTADGRWVRGPPPDTLSERVERITPTWKRHGLLDYAWPATTPPPDSAARPTLSLFAAAAALPLARRGALASVHSLAHALHSELGLCARDFDEPARRALVEMLTWRLPPHAEDAPLPTNGSLTLLVLSFDATADCRAVDDCPRPGPTNELLAATAIAFVRRRHEECGQHVDVIAQWEVAAAMRSQRAPAHPVGRPGRFENTAQILEYMWQSMAAPCATREEGRAAECNERERSRVPGHVVLLSHPDHLRRGLRIAETTFRRAAAEEQPSCPPVRIVPAMQPFRLDWPDPSLASSRSLDLYSSVSTRVHTQGYVRDASWNDDNLGFFPDGDPQFWAHRREVWLCYEFWARAFGVVTNVIE